jgi:hypothetical protein
MTTPSPSPEALAAGRDDLAYHQLRVLLLVTRVAGTPGHQGKLDGLTKLAKLDFLVRYPAVAPRVLAELDPHNPQLHLNQSPGLDPTDVEAPMIRYKYGPWDDRYYPVIGALVGRELLRYVAGRRGSVALAPTADGKRIAGEVAQTEQWAEIADRCQAIANASTGLSGTALKDLIYQQLPELMDRPHREVIR